jgi:hypothetical protein
MGAQHTLREASSGRLVLTKMQNLYACLSPTQFAHKRGNHCSAATVGNPNRTAPLGESATNNPCSSKRFKIDRAYLSG